MSTTRGLSPNSFYTFILALIVFTCLSLLQAEKDFRVDERSPLNQHLPDCSKLNTQIIKKQSSWRGILCPMVKDEVGFLSEWVAYYELQGFTKIIIFDHNSTSSLAELDPWIKDGFVEIVHEKWWNEPWLFRNKRNKFKDIMHIKYASEIICKQRAVDLGYEIFASLDIDEYLLPRDGNLTVIDDLKRLFLSTGRSVIPMNKYNFNSVPHILEPINLLTIEAYQTRMLNPNKMNYYTSVLDKIALYLTQDPLRSNVTKDTLSYMINCCDFHGCNNMINRRCRQLLGQSERWKLEGKHLKWETGPHINRKHFYTIIKDNFRFLSAYFYSLFRYVFCAVDYSRSLEKFQLKHKSYETASNGKENYGIANFFERSFGYLYDGSAVHWGCQIRQLLANRTGEKDYLRPGDFWFRNPEFGKIVEDPGKRGRFGAAKGKALDWQDMNPYPVGETYQRSHRAYKPPS